MEVFRQAGISLSLVAEQLPSRQDHIMMPPWKRKDKFGAASWILSGIPLSNSLSISSWPELSLKRKEIMSGQESRERKAGIHPSLNLFSNKPGAHILLFFLLLGAPVSLLVRERRMLVWEPILWPVNH